MRTIIWYAFCKLPANLMHIKTTKPIVHDNFGSNKWHDGRGLRNFRHTRLSSFISKLIGGCGCTCHVTCKVLYRSVYLYLDYTDINLHQIIFKEARGWFNIKMPPYQYRKSHCGDKTILRPSYLHNGISYTGKMTYLYWIRAQKSGDVYRKWICNITTARSSHRA